MNKFVEELNKTGIFPEKIEEIREKDSISLYRLYANKQTYVAKYFGKTEDTREILYYSLLKNAGVPTINTFGHTARMIIMEDLTASQRWRLGTDEDMSDSAVAANLAQWYRTFHAASKEILEAKTEWYSEYGLLTHENFLIAAEKAGTVSMKFWNKLTEYLPELLTQIQKLDAVVNYNDFYYTNLAVGRNQTEAIMYDYNFMGKGYRVADVRNVCASLSDSAADAFKESYGPIPELEYKVDDVVSMLTTLVLAAKRPEMPYWAEDAIHALKSGKLEVDLYDLICG